MIDSGLSVSYGQNHYGQNAPREDIQHPKMYSNVSLGINRVSESCLLTCSLHFTPLPVQNPPQDSVRVKRTGRKPKIKQKSWNIDPSHHRLYPKSNYQEQQVVWVCQRAYATVWKEKSRKFIDIFEHNRQTTRLANRFDPDQKKSTTK